MMHYWLFKADPIEWSFFDQMKKAPLPEEWNGVRNYAARNNMRLMKKGEKGFFYHSGKERRIMGIVTISEEAHRERNFALDSKIIWECVDVTFFAAFKKPVSLTKIKNNPKLCDMELVKNSRLSVQKVKKEEWEEICLMADL